MFLAAAEVLGSEPGRPDGVAQYLLYVSSVSGNTKGIRGTGGGRKAPSTTPDPTVSPSFPDCGLILTHKCPFLDLFFLVPQ